MISVLNKDTGEVVGFPDATSTDEIELAIKSDQYGAITEDKPSMLEQAGQAISGFVQERAPSFYDNYFKPAFDKLGENLLNQPYLVKEDPKDWRRAFTSNFANSATFGIMKAEDQAALNAEHPIASTAGQFAGFAAPMKLIGVGLNALKFPELVSSVVRPLEMIAKTRPELAPTIATAQKAISGGMQAGASMGIYSGVSDIAAQAETQDHIELQKVGENVLHDVAFWSIAGGVGGAVAKPLEGMNLGQASTQIAKEISTTAGTLYIAAKMAGASDKDALLQGGMGAVYHLVNTAGNSLEARNYASESVERMLTGYIKAKAPQIPDDVVKRSVQEYMMSAKEEVLTDPSITPGRSEIQKIMDHFIKAVRGTELGVDLASEEGFVAIPGEPGKVKEATENIYSAAINRFQAIENTVEKAKKLGAEVLPGEDTGLLARAYLGIGNKVREVLESKTFRITPEGRYEFTGEGLKPILDRYEEVSTEKNPALRSRDLEDYQIARRTVEDLQRPKSEWDREYIATPKQVAEAKATLDRLSQKYGNTDLLEQTAQRLYKYRSEILHLLVDSGNMSEAQYGAIMMKNPHYVPFDRVMEEIAPAGGTPVSKKRFTGARSPVKKIKGSELEIHNTIESDIKNTYRIMDIADRNKVVRSLAKLETVLPEEISNVEIKMVPVATVEHRAAIDKDFMTRLASFAKSLGATTKTTGQPGKNLGVYYPSGKRITRKFATPREVQAHETAHFFDDKFSLKDKFYKRGESKAVAEELIEHMKRMGESDNRMKKTAERFADGFEWWLTHRDLANRDLPLFSAEMEKIISAIPELKPILDIEPQPGLSIERQKETIFRPSQFKPKGDVLEYFENGERRYVKVTKPVYEAMTGLNEASVGMLTKILAAPAHTLRVGATITPEFMLRNPIRDQWTAFMQTNLGFIPFIDTGKALADVIGKSESYKDWLRSGGAYAGFVELSRDNLKNMVKDLTGNRGLLSRLNIIARAQDISQLFEQATRVAVYKAGVKKGLSPIEAGFQSREATIDFGRRGAQTKDINAAIAFFNAGIQGTDKLLRTAKKDPAGTMIKGLATITIPSVISYLLNKDDPQYKEIPRWQKDLFWIFKVGDNYWRIPKPFAYGQVFGSLPERYLEYLNTHDPKALDGYLQSLYESLTPVSGDPVAGMMATGIKPLIENAANWSFFRNAQLIPEHKTKLLPAEQYGRYTSETAKKLGDLLNYPPAKIDNLISGWFGGSGKYATDILDKIIEKATGEKQKEAPKGLSDIPLVKGFAVRPPSETQSESEILFYRNRDKVEAAHNSIQKNIKEHNAKEVERIRREHPEFKYYRAFDRVSKLLSELNKYSDAIIQSDRPEAEKKDLLKKIGMRQIDIAAKANSYLKANKQDRQGQD